MAENRKMAFHDCSQLDTAKRPSGKYELLFGLEDRPPLLKMLLYGAQWALLFLPMITVSAGVVSSYLGFGPAEETAFLGRILLISGGIMVLQTLFGHRLPLLDGPSSVIMLVLIALAPLGLASISGGFICGGILTALLGFLGLFRYIKNLFTDLVVGVITSLIALSLIPFMLPLILGRSSGHPHGDPSVLLVSALIMATMILFTYRLKTIHRTYSFLWAIVLGAALMMAIGKFSLPDTASQTWFRFPRPFWGPKPELDAVSIATFMIAYLAVVANEVGSIYSIAEVVGNENLESKLHRGIGFTGLGGAVSGVVPTLGTVSYALSPGVVFATRVGSRFALTACGGIVLVAALCEKLNAFLAAIPLPVVGAALMVAMGSQLMVGMSIVFRKKGELSSRDYYVAGVPLILGTAASILPQPFLDLLPLWLRVMVGNGMVVGIVSVLLLEHVLLRNGKEHRRTEGEIPVKTGTAGNKTDKDQNSKV
ncbi:MAG: purine/pyrimidine permease [Deltaproteobacteria bacterium]|nr:purine/pyrimidine permease [Deltaproteobacteria bacterium]